MSLEDKRNLNPMKRERRCETSQDDWNPKPCVYCSKKDLKSSNYKTLTKAEDRKKSLSAKK